MSQLSSQRHHPPETTESMNSANRSAMSSLVTKNVSATQRINQAKPLANQSGKPNGDPANAAVEDPTSKNKPQTSSARRSPTKSSVSPTSYKRLGSGSPAGAPMRFENQYLLKKKRYIQMKKELLNKQKAAQDTYNEAYQLREKVLANGGRDPGKLEDLKFEVGCPMLSLQHDSELKSEQADTQNESHSTGSEFMKSFENQLYEIPKKTRNMCQELLDNQSNLLTFITSILTGQVNETSQENNNDLDIPMQLAEYQKEVDNKQTYLNGLEITENQIIKELVKDTREIIDNYENHKSRMKQAHTTENQELRSQLDITVEELQMEKDKNNQTKDQQRRAEVELQKAKTKMRELETHVVDYKGKMQQLQDSIKNLESQMKQKDQTMDSRLKDMQKTMKNSKTLVAKVEKQRDSFETRMMELREKMLSNESDAVNTINEVTEKLNTVTTELDMEKQRRQETEVAFCELEERYKTLDEKSQQLCELAEKNKEFTVTDGSHTDNEVRLFNELQDLKEELHLQKEITMQLQREKDEIVAVMHQAANIEEDTREKLAAELVLKSNELQNLMLQYSELKKVAKNVQERNGTLEKQLKDIQTQLQSQIREGGESGLSAQAIELQQLVSDLQNNLAGVIRQKEELETALTQKQLEVEQRDRVMREQSKVLKVRDELLDLLKGKNQEENGETLSSDENNEYMEQIAAKTEAIQELYTTLENKQLQILRLEKMVKLMEDQQDRAQAQRTRLENRIAQLELALQRTKEQRGKGFGIL